MFFSIVIPTYNEEADIVATLEKLLALDYSEYEILVVDESSDRTPELVQSFEDDRIQYRRQTRGTGRSAARNQGIVEAKGEVVLILNADVFLPASILKDLAPLYEAGADFVVIESEVENTNALLPRYVQALHIEHYGPGTTTEMNWSEGFSCRRSAAIDAGLFPEGDAAPMLAGEDGWFGENLRDKGYKKVQDRSIKVTHVMPEDWKTFYHNRLGRGHGSSQVWALNEHQHGWQLTKTVYTHVLLGAIGLITLIPIVYRASRLASHSPRGWFADIIPFSVVRFVESYANIRGLLQGYQEVKAQ